MVNDTHRLTETRPFLAALIATVDRVFPAEKRPELRMLVAAGTHKSDRLERAGHEERMAAPFLKRFVEIAWHDADAPACVPDATCRPSPRDEHAITSGSFASLPCANRAQRHAHSEHQRATRIDQLDQRAIDRLRV